MLSAIVATHDSERTLVPTLSALVPGVTSGLLLDVVVADGGSRDATAEVADIAGCRFMQSGAPLGTRLREAAKAAKGSWLLFLPAGSIPSVDWPAAAERFIADAGRFDRAGSRAASFRPERAGDLARPALAALAALLRQVFGGVPHPDRGLLIARCFYDALGGHGGGAGADVALMRAIGRRRIAILPAGVVRRD
jgi:glycosyltransferase involved in cell wall biosynthesis